MKVLHCIDGLHPGGKERRLVELLKSLAPERSVESELLVMSDVNRYPEVFTLGIPVWKLIRTTPHDLGVFRRLYRLLRERRPHVVHTWDPMTSFYAAPVAALLGIPLINGMVTKAPARLPWRSRERITSVLTFPLSAAVVANSEAGLRSYRVPAAKARCIHNGFDSSRLQQLVDPGETRRRLGIATRFVVAMVGEFTPKKDYPTFVRSANLLLAARGDVTFLAVGDGPTREAAMALVDESCRSRVLFPGWVDRVESLMRAVDAGVLATDADVHGEGIPNAVLEFMALGKPVVATRTGGTAELVVDGQTGFLVENKDPATLALRITGLLNDPSLARTLGDCAMKRVQLEFSMEKMTRSFIRLYAEFARLS